VTMLGGITVTKKVAMPYLTNLIEEDIKYP
jgi:hypothetical protein